MDIITDAQLLARIDEFLARTKMKPSSFGRKAMGDGALLQGLRAGRSLSLKNAEKVVAFMDGYEAEAPAEAA